MSENFDIVPIAEGVTHNFNSDETGRNNNVLVIAGTGKGKTTSVVFPEMLYTNNSSLVVPISKREVLNKFREHFIEKGYAVRVLDLIDVDSSLNGYDPLFYINDQSDILDLASKIVEGASSSIAEMDSYWSNAATSLIAAEMSLLIEEWAYSQDESGENLTMPPSMLDVLALHSELVFYDANRYSEFTSSSLDEKFAELEKISPQSYAVSCWKTVKRLASKTVSCVASHVNVAYTKLFTSQMKKIIAKPTLDISLMGEEKTVLFVVTSPVNKSAQLFANLFYASLFKEFFDLAEKQRDLILPVPVHIICDDFACGCKIPRFPEYISILRSCGVSVTILIQSETQLADMYGFAGANTIVDNCDTMLYMGGMSLQTCSNMSRRVNMPLEDIISMPIGVVYVVRAGEKPQKTNRYNTYADERYRQLIG